MGALDRAQVWVRNKDGTDTPRDLTEEMIPARGDKPCFRSIDPSANDTFGKAVISQTDAETGKKCLKEVPVEDTDEAYLAGYQTETVCDGVPDIRPKRIIPEDIEGCPDNIRILAAVEEEVEILPGLKKLKTLWRWLKSIVLSDANLESRNGEETDGSCVLPAVWVRNGDCSTLAKAQLEDGVLGAWAYCGSCLKFYELPKGENGEYQTNMVLHFISGNNCWEWKAPGNACALMLDAPVTIFTGAALTLAGTKTYSVATHNPPECAEFAILSNTIAGNLASGSSGFWLLSTYLTPTSTSANTAPVIRVAPQTASYDVDAGLAEVPIINGQVKLETTRSGSWASLEGAVRLIGFR